MFVRSKEERYLQIVVAFCTQMGKVVALLLLAAVRFVPNWFVHCGRTKNRLKIAIEQEKR